MYLTTRIPAINIEVFALVSHNWIPALIRASRTLCQTCAGLFNPHNNPSRVVFLLNPFHREAGVLHPRS